MTNTELEEIFIKNRGLYEQSLLNNKYFNNQLDIHFEFDSPLRQAIQYRYIKNVIILLEAGSFVNSHINKKNSPYGMPLISPFNNQLDIAKILIQNNADILADSCKVILDYYQSPLLNTENINNIKIKIKIILSNTHKNIINDCDKVLLHRKLVKSPDKKNITTTILKT